MTEEATKQTWRLKVCDIFELDQSDNSKRLADLVLRDGRQALSTHRDDFGGRVYREEIQSNDGQLLSVLKDYVEHIWYEETPSWFQEYLQQQRINSPDLYDQILIRMADYESKFIKHCLVLSLAIQFVFELSDDVMLQTTIYDDICRELIVNGRQGIQKCQDHLPGRVLKERNSVLTGALREYYSDPLRNMLQDLDVNIINPDTFEIILTAVVDHGWWSGVNDAKVTNAISIRRQKIIQQKLLDYFQKQNLPVPPNTSMEVAVAPSSTISRPWFNTESMSHDSFLSIGKKLLWSDGQFTSNGERDVVQSCIAQYEQLTVKDLLEAGELVYMDKTFNTILKSITDNYTRHKNYPKFIRSCLTPMMYLLKRHQNLDDFMQGLFQEYCNLDKRYTVPELSLRMLIDVLLLNADSCLSRKIMVLLSKQNSVPFVQPSLNDDVSFRFVADIIHVWDHSIPTILSFAIGPCQGKSSLLNRLFLCSFEQHLSSIYFSNTIDIDFGYNFSPRRSINVADVHGSISKNLLERIHSLFDGFLIHVTYHFLLENPSVVVEQCNMINKREKRRILLIRDVPEQYSAEEVIDQLNDLSSNQGLSSMFTQKINDKQPGTSSSILTLFLVNMCNNNDLSTKFRRVTLRDQILDEMNPEFALYRASIIRDLNTLLSVEYESTLSKFQNLNEKLIDILHCAADNDIAISDYFPEYSYFIKLCAYKSTLAQSNPFRSENYELFMKIRSEIAYLEKTLKQAGRSISIGLRLFLNVLQSSDMITCLELLRAKLNEKQMEMISSRIMAQPLDSQRIWSVETLWRNAAVCSNNLNKDIRQTICKCYSRYIDAGFPFEIIDGDNFYLQYRFLETSLIPFKQNRILVISVIGPRNSGKSTLLNYMFGTTFGVRDGGCTRGVYGSFIKANRPNYDSILVIDTKGLLSLEREDDEYDRRIVQFCLGVSHIVIVNMNREFDKPFQEMLKLNARFLGQSGGTNTSPTVHFVFNQCADPNIENHHGSVRKLMADLKRNGFDEYIDVRKENFHALPAAYRIERQTRTSDTRLGSAIRSESNFIQCVQELTKNILSLVDQSLDGKIKLTAPLQWLTSSLVMIENWRQPSSLTSYKDRNERLSDNKFCDDKQNYLNDIFSAHYFDKFCIESSDKDQQKFETIRATDAGDGAKEFIQHGEAVLRSLIETSIQSGRQMSSNNAQAEFQKMFDQTMNSIKRQLIPANYLQETIENICRDYRVHGNDINIEFEKLLFIEDFLERVNATNLSINQIEDELVEEIIMRGSRNPLVQSFTFKCDEELVYLYDTIETLSFLNRDLLNSHFSRHHKLQSTTAEGAGVVPVKSFITSTVAEGTSDFENQGSMRSQSTESFRTEVRKAIKAETTTSSEKPLSTDDEKTTYLSVRKIIAEVVRNVTQYMNNLEMNQHRRVNSEVIENVVLLVNSIINQVEKELEPFGLALSRAWKSSFQTCAIVLLTKYHYDTQMNIFHSILNSMEKKRQELENYFVSTVTSESIMDEFNACILIEQLNDFLIESFTNDSQRIINDIHPKYDHVNRKWIQDQCDNLSLSTDNIQWTLDYLSDPNTIIEKYFEDLRTDLAQSLDKQMMEEKLKYNQLIEQFFSSLPDMLKINMKFGDPTNFVENAFLSDPQNGLNPDQNLVNKQKCMGILFQQYFTKTTIPKEIDIDGSIYRTQHDVLDAFEDLIKYSPPSKELLKIINDLSTTMGKISIANFSIFLEHLIEKKQTISNNLNTVGRQKFRELLLDKLRGCTETCPCCKRRCEIDHTQMSAASGTGFNQHRCLNGHGPAAMIGCRFDDNDETFLLTCEQLDDDHEITIDSIRCRWSAFKRQHSAWNFDSILNENELAQSRNKYLAMWSRVKPLLSQKYEKSFFPAKVAPAPARKFEPVHYILILDKSSSMSSNNRWPYLIEAVYQFLQRRCEMETDDRCTIITFSPSISYLYENKPLIYIDTASFGHPKDERSFNEAVDSVIEMNKVLNKDVWYESLQENIVILFTSGGQVPCPIEELRALQARYKSRIKRFWTIALCNEQSQYEAELETINNEMNGSLHKAETAEGLVEIYDIIAEETFPIFDEEKESSEVLLDAKFGNQQAVQLNQNDSSTLKLRSMALEFEEQLEYWQAISIFEDILRIRSKTFFVDDPQVMQIRQDIDRVNKKLSQIQSAMMPDFTVTEMGSETNQSEVVSKAAGLTSGYLPLSTFTHVVCLGKLDMSSIQKHYHSLSFESFGDPVSCISSLNQLNVNDKLSESMALVILVGSNSTAVVPIIHDLSLIREIDVIDAACPSFSEQYRKVSLVVADDNQFMKILRSRIRDEQRFNDGRQRFIVLSEDLTDNLKMLPDHADESYWHQVQPVWFTKFVRLLCETPFKDQDTKSMYEELIKTHRSSSEQQLSELQRFAEMCTTEDPSIWMSYDSFIYDLLQTSLYSNHLQNLFPFRTYLSHLYQWCKTKHSTQNEYYQQCLRCSLSKDDFKELQDHSGRLVLAQGFLTSIDTTNHDDETSIGGAIQKSDEQVLVDIVVDNGTREYPFYPVKRSHDSVSRYFCLPGTLFRIINVDVDETSTPTGTCIKLRFGKSEEEKFDKVMRGFDNLIGGKVDFDNLGQYLCRIGRWNETAQYYMNLSPIIDLHFTSSINSYIGYYYAMRKSYDASLTYYEKCLNGDTFTEGDKENRSNYTIRNFVDAEEDNPSTSIRILSPVVECTSKSDLHNNLGWIHMKRGINAERAVEHFTDAKKMAKNRVYSRISASLNLSCLYYQQCHYSQSLIACEEALQTALMSLESNDPIVDACLDNITIIVRVQQSRPPDQVLKSASS